VQTLVSSLPIRNLNGDDRIAIVEGMMKVVSVDGQLIQFTYAGNCPFSNGIARIACRTCRSRLDEHSACRCMEVHAASYPLKYIALPSALRASGLAANNSRNRPCRLRAASIIEAVTAPTSAPARLRLRIPLIRYSVIRF